MQRNKVLTNYEMFERMDSYIWKPRVIIDLHYNQMINRKYFCKNRLLRDHDVCLYDSSDSIDDQDSVAGSLTTESFHNKSHYKNYMRYVRRSVDNGIHMFAKYQREK